MAACTKFEIFGIRFAPLSVPLERRLQTLAAGTWFILILIGNFVGTFIFLFLFFTPLWWASLAYSVWMYLDWNSPERGGHYNPWVLNWKMWHYFRDYFPSHLVYTSDFELDKNRNYLFCCFPHGVMPAGPVNTLLTHAGQFFEKYPNFVVKVATLRMNCTSPFYREYNMGFGCISSSRESLNFVLGKPQGGNIVLLFPGGAEESFYSTQHVFVVKNRKGFIKTALQNGVPLVPVLTFGQHEIYNQVESPIVRKCQKYIKNLTGFAPLVVKGRGFFQYSFGLVPHRKEMTTILGTPIEVTKEENPTNELIDELHQKFVGELVKLFEENKQKYLENSEEIHVVLI